MERKPYSEGETVMLGRGTYRLVGKGGSTWMVGMPRQVEVLEDEYADAILVRDAAAHVAWVTPRDIARIRESSDLESENAAPAPDETYFCDLCDTPVPAGAAGDDVVCRGCGRVLSLAPSAPADPAPAIDRSTDIQRNGALLQQQADAIKATAQALEPLIIDLAHRAGEGAVTTHRGSLAKLEGIIGLAMQMAGEAGLVISADEYQQQRRQAAEGKLEALEAAGIIDRETLENV